jgi:transcriptional regulator with XRE-family HTH domain
MERPPSRPEGALIRLARQAAGLSIPDAVRLSGVSKARWSQVESGYERRDGVTRPVQAKADTLARMAHAVGLPPERLELEGQRPDAAEILREILRRKDPEPGSGATPQEVAREKALLQIMEDARLPLSTRLAMVALARAMREANEQESRRDQDTA